MISDVAEIAGKCDVTAMKSFIVKQECRIVPESDFLQCKLRIVSNKT